MLDAYSDSAFQKFVGTDHNLKMPPMQFLYTQNPHKVIFGIFRLSFYKNPSLNSEG